MKSQKKKGVLLSYLNILLNMCANLVLVPMLIGALSDEAYSIYKVMQSFAGPLIMFNMGLSTIAARSIAMFRARETEEARKEKENTLALALLIAAAMAALVMLCGFLMRWLVPVVFGETYAADQLELARQLLMVFTGITALKILLDVFRGCSMGNEQFVFYYGSSTVMYLLRFGSIYLLTRLPGCSALQVALVDLVIYGLVLLANLFHTFGAMKEKFRLHWINARELMTIGSFSAAILLQAIITQVNSNVDNVLLGAMVENKEIITMYSSALSIYAIFNTLSSVLINVYFPKAARLVAEGASPRALTDLVIGTGRFQAVLVLGVIGGFALFGKNFIGLWIGERYQNGYYVTLLLILSAAVPQIQSVCISLLDALLKRICRSVILLFMAVLNVIVSVILLQRIGYMGAAVGTALSHIVGELILMNLYYHKALHLEVGRMFREIFRGILPAWILAVTACLPASMLLGDSSFWFLVKCGLFVAVYGIGLWILGLNKEEKNQILSKSPIGRRRVS